MSSAIYHLFSRVYIFCDVPEASRDKEIKV